MLGESDLSYSRHKTWSTISSTDCYNNVTLWAVKLQISLLISFYIIFLLSTFKPQYLTQQSFLKDPEFMLQVRFIGAG
jgi:hypothetical protein